MKPELLEVLSCPRCGTGALGLEPLDEDAREVRSGRLGCVCGGSYSIRAGVVDFVAPEAEGSELAPEDDGEPQDPFAALATDEATLLNHDAILRARVARDPEWPGFALHLNLDRVLSGMDLASGDQVLDLGAGVTAVTLRLALAGARAVAVDPVRRRYEGLDSADTLMRHHEVHYERVRTPLARLPFRAGCFDLVLAHGALGRSGGPEATLAEAARVLRPGGRLWLVNEPVDGWLTGFPGDVPGLGPDRGGSPRRLAHYRRALRSAGLTSRCHFPPSLAARMDALAARRGGRPSRLARHLFSRHLYRLGRALFGQLLLLEARRPSPPE